MAKRKKAEETPKEDSFTPLFLSLSIILLAFFIMLNSIATLEASKVRKAVRSFQTSRAGLGIFGPGVGLFKTGNPEGEVLLPEPTAKGYDTIHQSLTKWGRDNQVTDAYEDERRLVFTLPEFALFDVGSNTLNPVMFKALDEIGTMIKQANIPVTVQGHTDAAGVTGGSSNWQLSAGRALEVARYLIEGVGVPPNLVEAEAFGEFRPVASNDAPEGRLKNRRVDLVFYKHKLPK